MSAQLKINNQTVHYDQGHWSCEDAALQARLMRSCVGDYPGFHPDPDGADIDLALRLFGGELVKRDEEKLDPAVVY